MSDGLRKAWHSLGAGHLESLGFTSYFARMTKALTIVLNRCGSDGSLRSWVWQLHRDVGVPSRLKEFKKGGRKSSASKTSLRQSPSHVFPLPPMSRAGTVVEARSLGGIEDECIFYGGNLALAALNWLHGGQTEGFGILSAAHERVHSRVGCVLRALVMTDESILDHSGLDSYLRQSQLYSGLGVVLPLGERGGVPAKAADVPLASHLQKSFPEMSEQVLNPKALLLSSKQRPKRIQKGYTWVSSTYPSLVLKNIKAGLHRFKKTRQVAKHRGKRILCGAFAVAKDETEDRVITDPSVNQLLDPKRMPRPRFAFVPMLRVITVPKQGKILVSKRDARHYFHRLRIGRRWEKYLCGPPVKQLSRQGQLVELYPACRSTPMGFGPSAGWAQGLTDVVALDAGLPVDSRVHPDHVVPSHLPVWGSIIDDIWALEHADYGQTASIGPDWLGRAEQAWVLRGVEPNLKKNVDGLADQEVQGYWVDGEKHWVGVSLQKRRFLFQATMAVLMRRKVMVGVVDRLIGKHSFVHSCRAVLRSVFDHTYTWISSVREHRRELATLPVLVWEELCVSAILLMYAQFDLSSHWSNRVECSDASMTGLGRAYGVIPEHVAQTLARYSSHSSAYTNLKLPWSIGLTQEHKCPLKKVRIPVERIKWKFLGVPWDAEHITLSEADAIAWTAEDRLRRPGDCGARFIHPVDSAACCGAFTKGRSSSSRLNSRCRKVGSICLAGGHDVFYPWMASQENPADEPSRWFEKESKSSAVVQVDLESAEPVADLCELGPWPSDTWFFLHLCSGPRRPGDVLDNVENFGAEHGLNVVGIAVDPLAVCNVCGGIEPPSGRGDLFNANWGDWLLRLIHSGCVAGGMGSPPCSTVSAARHVPLQDSKGAPPRPLRSRTNPWYPLSYCTDSERLAVQVGSV